MGKKVFCPGKGIEKEEKHIGETMVFFWKIDANSKGEYMDKNWFLCIEFGILGVWGRLWAGSETGEAKRRQKLEKSLHFGPSRETQFFINVSGKYRKLVFCICPESPRRV